MLRALFAPDNRKSHRMRLTKHKSATVSETKGKPARMDRRALRTRQRLDGAFVELLHRRAYGNIRVSDITRKAAVGRATFYAHYCSKDDLLRSQFNRVVAPMLAVKTSDACPLDASAFFAHVLSAPKIYKALTGPHAGGAPRVLRECFELRAEAALSLCGRDSHRVPGSCNEQKTILKRFIASSLLTVIECSIETNAGESASQLQAVFGSLVGGGLSAFGAGWEEEA
jgi:AcrR family transcriptional regulator